MQPVRSYTIWFTQRTGSSLLCKALEATGIAGVPGEWLHNWIREHYEDNSAALQRNLWANGSTSNGVFGLKHSFYEPHFSHLLELFRRFPSCPPEEKNRVKIWEYAFPNHRHIFMTRRNKVRLAVSWWKAIQTQEWHRVQGQVPRNVELANAYSFDAIDHLYEEVAMREAGIQEFLTEGNIAPLTLVYEDFIQEYDKTIKTVLEFLELDATDINIPAPFLMQTADTLSEEWVQRFREERQQGWQNRGW